MSDLPRARLTVQQAQDQISKARDQGYRPSEKKTGVVTRNLKRVFSAIVTVDGPSAQDIAGILDLSPGTVSGLVTQLENLKFVRVVSGRTASQGRRPKPIVIDDRIRHIVGFEISAEKVTGVVMNLAGEAVLDQTVDLGSEVWTKAGNKGADKGWVDQDKVVDSVRGIYATLKEQLLDHIAGRHPDILETGHDPIVGIGVVLGGHINRHTGEVLFAPDLRWGTPRRRQTVEWGPTVQLRQRIRDVTGVDQRNIVVDNDANGRAAAYQLYGGGAYFNDAPSTVVLVTDVGVGAAHFIDQEIYRGATGKSLEFGNILMVPNGLPCRCGDRGCLEAVATCNAILASSKFDTLEEAYAAAANGNDKKAQAAAIKGFTDAGTLLGTGLSILVDLLDTSRIVLTGPAITHSDRSGPIVFDQHYDRAMREAVQEHVYGAGIDPDNIEVIAEDGEWNGARGAACLVVHDMIAGHLGYLEAKSPRKTVG
ncbi:ROK family protein [Nocardia fluminea]|uniref:ROK family protein n=1 Tax=Nocardia fluminea TaxID=134984 RepID=UPI0037905544